jgi:phosphatidate cytidylyltransferase
MLRKRTLSTVVGLPIVIAAIWFGLPWFTILMSCAAVIGALEFYKITSRSGIKPLTYFGAVFTLLLVISPHCPSRETSPAILTLAIIASLTWLLFKSSHEQTFIKWAWTIGGILYIGWMLSYWVELRNLDSGREWVLWAIITIFAGDTCAFFIGKALGRHPLAPAISPSKTWEGSIGGLLAGIGFSLLIGTLFSLPISLWYLALLGAGVSILAQIGDLVESLLKRNMGVKDSGNLIPGHGGFLDRLDSLTFTGVFVYYFIILLNNTY